MQRRDLLGLYALEVAFDYAGIVDALPLQDGPVASLRRELARSLGGPLKTPDDAREPLQLQSQLVVRSAFARGGVRPYHPTHSTGKGRKSSDILLSNELSEYAVEVKRPSAARNILPRPPLTTLVTNLRASDYLAPLS